jgi:chaperonin GroEL
MIEPQNSDIVKDVRTGTDAKKQLISGANILAQAVASTLGAGGKTVIIEDKFGRPHVTKDGANVADSIYLENPIENIGAQVLKQASKQTADEAGDGTTTSTVIAMSLLKSFQENYNVETKRNIVEATELLKDILTHNAKKVTPELLRAIAIISANNDTVVGELVYNAFEKAGDGVVTFEASKSTTDSIEVVDGLEVDRGYSSEYFVNDLLKKQVVLTNPLILIVESEIHNFSQIRPYVETAIKNKRPFVIMGDIDHTVQSVLVANVRKGVLQAVHTALPLMGDRRKDICKDLSILTGAILISDDYGDNLEVFNEEYFGEAERMVCKKNTSVIKAKDDRRELIDEHIETLKQELDQETSKQEKRWLKERIGRLSSGLVYIKVGGYSEVEQREKMDRVEDAVKACRAAKEQGVVAGGGIALLDAVFDYMEMIIPKEDVTALIDAVVSPYMKIMSNAEFTSEEIMDFYEKKRRKVHRVHTGVNVKTKEVGNMFSMGVVDPLKVTLTALDNAVSVATTIMNTECVITNKRLNEI